MSGALKLFAAEALAIHSICDRHGIPRAADGEKLSMAQRVELLSKLQTQTIRMVLGVGNP